MYCRCIPVFLLSILLAPPVHGQRETLPGDTLAMVGAQPVTAREFLERLELMPWPGKDRRSEQDSVKIRALKSLVAEKLLSQNAAVEGVGQDPAWQFRRGMLERLLVRDELYKRDVVDRVSISNDERRRALEKLPRATDLLFLHAGTEEAARRLSALLRATPRPDSTLGELRSRLWADTLSIALGTSDYTLEDTAFALSPSRRLSGPVNSDLFGWGVALLLRERINPQWAGKSVNERLRLVNQILRARKQDLRAARVAGSILGPRRAEADPELFEGLAGFLLPRLLADSSNRRTQRGFRLTAADLADADRAMQEDRDRLFVTYADGGLTVRELLAALQQQAPTFRSLEEERFKDDLNRAIKNVVAADLISREAYRRNLQETGEVRHDLATWEDHWAAAAMVERIASAVTVSDEDAVRFLAFHGAEQGSLYEVNIREVLVDSLAEALEVLREFSAGADLSDLASGHSRRRGWNQRGGESGYFNVGAYPVLGFPALYQPERSVAGPLRVPEGYSIFTPLGKRMAKDGGPPTGLDSLLAFARRAAAAEKGSNAVNARVDSLAREAGVWLNLERLRTLSIIPSNMVTQRFIGFGGTILAVPALLPVWQWQYRPPGRLTRTPL